jgi:pyrimidine-nucleoside phosphorylase
MSGSDANTEFSQAVSRARSGNRDAYAEIIALAKTSEIDPESVAELARCMAESASQLRSRPQSADIASTGGPGSLTTLLCPLILRAHGCIVPKVAVQGRPAGGVDVLGSLEGYRVDLDAAEAESCLDEAGYVHVLAGERFAPMDAELFRLRQERDAQGIPSLVAASLLSKKLAAGSPVAGLDIRVGPHGNFGRDLGTASANARMFEESAVECGLVPRTFIGESSGLEQPWIGRGEALSALDLLLSGEPDEWLLRHADRCSGMAAAVARAAGLRVEVDGWNPELAERAREAMRANLRAQGSSLEALERRAAEVRHSESVELRAGRAGVIEIDIGAVRSALVEAQLAHGGRFPDPAGVRLLVEEGTAVGRGDPLAAVRSEMSHRGPTLEALSSAISVSGDPATLGKGTS